MYNYKELEFELLKGVDEKQHFHPDIEILFVLEGQAGVWIQGRKFLMEKEDIILVNASMPHEIVCSGESVLGRVYYSYALLADVLQGENCIFFCNSVLRPNLSYGELRAVFHDLVYQHVRGRRKTYCQRDSLLFRLLDILVEKFHFLETVETEGNPWHDERISRIIHYVNRNYQTGISLTELAEEMYVSASTLSRLFKKEMGVYFADYVNQVRMKYALGELLYTDKSITRIAVDSGFSNPSGFNKVFRETYGLSPSEYRSVLKENAREEELKEQKLKEELRLELKNRAFEPVRLAFVRDEEVKISCGQGIPYEKVWGRTVNIGPISNLTLANLQYHAVYFKEQLGFTYVRVWNIFSRKLMLTDGKTIGNYNYDYINGIFDFLTAHHIKPFLDFGKRPDTAVSAEGESIYFEEEYVCFESRKAWEALFEDFIRHLIRRYGKEEVETWIFEFSYNRAFAEDSHCYLDENYDYFQVYLYGYRQIKQYLPGAKVGGFSGVFHWDREYMREFLDSCKRHSCLPDFVSFFLFPCETLGRTYKRIPDELYERREVAGMIRLLQELGIDRKQCEIYLTEWNSTLSSRNYLNDSCFRATYLARGAAAVGDQVDMMCVWMASDWVSNYYDTTGVLHGGNGLLTKEGICKPAYYAVQFLNKLGSRLLEKGDHYIITQSGPQEFYILCFYFSWYSGNYFLREENKIRPEDMDDIFEHREPVTLNITLQDIPPGRYEIKRQTVNREHGSILDEWKMFGYAHNLDSGDMKYLREICIPHLSLQWQEARDSQMKISVEMKEQEISLIHVYEKT